jgi:hypothetical protein
MYTLAYGVKANWIKAEKQSFGCRYFYNSNMNELKRQDIYIGSGCGRVV